MSDEAHGPLVKNQSITPPPQKVTTTVQPITCSPYERGRNCEKGLWYVGLASNVFVPLKAFQEKEMFLQKHRNYKKKVLGKKYRAILLMF